MDVCRACTSTAKIMFPLDDDFIYDYNLLTNLNITKTDGLPQYYCEKCLETVITFVEFREKCRLAEIALQEAILQVPKTEDDVKECKTKDIKQECYDEELNLDSAVIDSDYFINNDDIKKEQGEEDTKTSIKNGSETKSNKKLEQTHKGKKGRCKNKKNLEKKVQVLFCGICSETFNVKSDLMLHLEIHKSDKQCSECKDFFYDWPHILAHRFTHVPDDQKHCLLCNKKFRSEINFEFHFRKNHTSGEVKVNCRKCDKSFKNSKSLRSHLNINHSSNIYVCDICNKEYTRKKSLEYHLDTHSRVKKYSCDFCNYASYHRTNIYAHKLSKHMNKIKCKICKKVFKHQVGLDIHKCPSAGRICPICGVILDVRSFKRHLNHHTDIAQYKCDQCPATYRSRSGLKVHKDKHKGTKTQRCNYCMMKFYSPSVLTKHKRIHTGDKPYVCKICQKGFTGNHNLKVHMKVHGLHIVNKKNIEQSSNTSNSAD